MATLSTEHSFCAPSRNQNKSVNSLFGWFKDSKMSTEAPTTSATEDLEMEEEEEDDTELRDLVTNVLDANGILGKFKVSGLIKRQIQMEMNFHSFQAQLRANVYLALDDSSEELKVKSYKTEIKT